jgi:hypothetical protein
MHPIKLSGGFMLRILIVMILAVAANAAEPVANVLTLSSGKTPLGTAPLPSGWRVNSEKGKTILLTNSPSLHLEILALPSGSVEEAEESVATLVEAVIKNFAASRREDIEKDNFTGRHIVGTGEVAGGSAPRNSELFLFAVKAQVFVLVAYGEGSEVAKRNPEIIALLASLR